MRKYRYVVFLSLYFILLIPVLGQTNKKEERKFLKNGDIEYELEKYGLALPHYMEAHKCNKKNYLTSFKLGVCYMQTRQAAEAVTYFENAYSNSPKVDPEVLYHLAFCYQHVQRFDDAIEHYELYQSNSKKGHHLGDVERRIYECNNAKEFMDNPVEVSFENLEVINSSYPEYAPVFTADGKKMYFTSRREGSTGGELDRTGAYHEDIYVSEKNGDNWEPPVNLKDVNTALHDATVGISPDGKTLIIFKTEGIGDLYFCTMKENGEWTKPKKFPKEISSKYSTELSGNISSDGTLYFSSNREGGEGGFDIYMSKPDGENWSEPVNLGPVINTPFNDDAPFIDIDSKTLYFSSEGHKGMGEHDIFKSRLDETTGDWGEPENLGYPINTTDDDLYFVLSGDGAYGYVNSIREGGFGSEDIYRMTLPENEDIEDRLDLIEKITGTKVRRANDLAELDEAMIDEERILENNENSLVENEESDALETFAEGNELVEETTEDFEAPAARSPEPASSNYIIKGYIKSKGNGQPVPGAFIELANNMGEVIATKLSGNDGSYNFTLPDGASGYFAVSAEKKGFLFQSRKQYVDPEAVSKTMFLDLLLPYPELSSKVILRNVYYKFGQFQLTTGSYHELDKLVTLMNENANIIAEIASHTDNIGSDSYNNVLSKKRSNAVVNYLKSKGVNSSRLKPIGYGETRPMASNDDEIEGRELNRRTEFIIRGL